MVSNVLESVGLRPVAKTNKNLERDVPTQLEAVGLGIQDIFEQMACVLSESPNEVLKQKVRDSVLKMHGVLKESEAPPQSVTIVINDPNSIYTQNPILIPRPQREILEHVND